MTLDTKELTMDIPERYRSFASYRTTLGHKANHAFSPAANTDFRIVRHPLLGPICCLGTNIFRFTIVCIHHIIITPYPYLVATRAISEDAEVFVDYNYNTVAELVQKADTECKGAS